MNIFKLHSKIFQTQNQRQPSYENSNQAPLSPPGQTDHLTRTHYTPREFANKICTREQYQPRHHAPSQSSGSRSACRKTRKAISGLRRRLRPPKALHGQEGPDDKRSPNNKIENDKNNWASRRRWRRLTTRGGRRCVLLWVVVVFEGLAISRLGIPQSLNQKMILSVIILDWFFIVRSHCNFSCVLHLF